MGSGEFDPEDFTLTSFTRASAAVLAGRIDVPRHHIATLHALAYRALGSPPLAEKGELAKRWNEAHAALPQWQVAGGIASEEDGLAPPDAEVGEQLRLYSLARARIVPYGHPLWQLTRDFAVEWNDWKQETGSVDFADMLELAITHIDNPPTAVFIADEAQDFVPLQWELARKWGEAAEVCIFAGDPAQVLYSFAGSSPHDFLRELPADHQRLLGHSWRLPFAIRERAEGWLALHSGAVSAGRHYSDRGAPGNLTYSGATWRYPDDLLVELAEAKDTMVLATCSFMLAPLIQMLRDAGIPFANKYRRSNGSWNPLVAQESKRSTAGMVAAFAEGAEPDVWIEMLKSEAFMLRTAKSMIKGGQDVLGLLRPEHHDRYLARDLEWLAASVLPKYERPARFAARVIERLGSAALTKEPAVTVGTIHSVKGGEAETVYLFPDVSQAGWIEMHGSTEGHDAAVRLGYVGMTRASERLVLCTAVDAKRGLW